MPGRALSRSFIMKSMNSGTPASVALPERSSFGMMKSASTRTVSISCAVKNWSGAPGKPGPVPRATAAALSAAGVPPRLHAAATAVSAMRPTASRRVNPVTVPLGRSLGWSLTAPPAAAAA